MANARTNPTEWVELDQIAGLDELTDAQEIRMLELRDLFFPPKRGGPYGSRNKVRNVLVIEPNGRKYLYNSLYEASETEGIHKTTLSTFASEGRTVKKGKYKGYTFMYKERVSND